MDKPNEIRIGPITRARAKLIEQQVNSLLIESDVLLNENYILPKSLYVCIIRYQGVIQEEEIGRGQAARGKEPREDGEKGQLAQGVRPTGLHVGPFGLQVGRPTIQSDRPD